jgi:hypothetical protein
MGEMGPDNVYIHFTNGSDAQMRRVKETWIGVNRLPN